MLDQNQAHTFNTWSCWVRCMMLKISLHIHHTWHVVVSHVTSRTEVISRFEGLSCTGQDTCVEFKFLILTEKGTLKSMGFFGFFFYFWGGVTFVCVRNFTCPVFGHRARCEPGQLFQMSRLIRVVASAYNMNHSAGTNDSSGSSGWPHFHLQFLFFKD